jgi:hypothetical protein
MNMGSISTVVGQETDSWRFQVHGDSKVAQIFYQKKFPRNFFSGAQKHMFFIKA